MLVLLNFDPVWSRVHVHVGSLQALRMAFLRDETEASGHLTDDADIALFLRAPALINSRVYEPAKLPMTLLNRAN